MKIWTLIKEWFANLRKKPVSVSPTTTPISTKDPAGEVLSFNQFAVWKSQGLSLQEIIILKLHRGLTEAETAQALQAGYIPTLPPVEGVDRSNTDLSDGSPWEDEVADDTDVTLEYTLRPGVKKATIYVFGSRGTQLLEVTDGYGNASMAGSSANRREVQLPLLSGQRSYTFQKKSVGNWMAAQLVQS